MSLNSTTVTENSSQGPNLTTPRVTTQLFSQSTVVDQKAMARPYLPTQDRRKLARQYSKPLVYPAKPNATPGGSASFLNPDHTKPRTPDYTGCIVRRSKSEKNFGRMYYWNPDRRSYVGWVESITQEMMDYWYASLNDTEKNYWDQVYTNPADLQVALDAVHVIAPAPDAPQIPNDLTYAPYTPAKSIIETVNADIVDEITAENGFISVDQGIDQARSATTDADYRQLYRDTIFFLTHPARNTVFGMWSNLLNGMRKVEVEKMLKEKQMETA